jgi:hypothetical protein
MASSARSGVRLVSSAISYSKICCFCTSLRCAR